MAAYDLLIKNGTIVDGTRFPKYRADLAIKDGKVLQIDGRLDESDAERVLDATGLLVAPGFVDLHTHYDAQIQWDPWCTISGWHGVTSVVLGNCGFGFAPVRADERDRAMLTMSRTEAIPFESMQLGMLWDWITFPGVPRHAGPHTQGGELPELRAARAADDLGDGPGGGEEPSGDAVRARGDAAAAQRGDGGGPPAGSRCSGSVRTPRRPTTTARRW